MTRRRAVPWLAGGLSLAGGLLLLRRRRALRPGSERSSALGSPADELRRRLDESRGLADEREEFESGETPVDRAAEQSVDERRKAVHERGRSAAEEMRTPRGERS